jgi:hypothetical protein
LVDPDKIIKNADHQPAFFKYSTYRVSHSKIDTPQKTRPGLFANLRKLPLLSSLHLRFFGALAQAAAGEVRHAHQQQVTQPK